MIATPRLEERPEQPYLGIRTQVPMTKMKKAIPQLHSEVLAWMKEQGIATSGAPFVRFHVINMAGNMDIEMGWPVANAVPGNDRITAGVLPAGRYAALIYTGVKNGIKGNAALLNWGAEQALMWDRRDVEAGDAFAGRFEAFLTDPKDEPDPAKWEVEVAIRVKEEGR